MAYSYNPVGDWTSQHQMSMNGKRDGFTFQDFIDCANTVGLKQGQGAKIVREIQSVVSMWSVYAETAGLDGVTLDRVAKAHRKVL